MSQNNSNPFQPIVATTQGALPVTIRVVGHDQMHTEGGVQSRQFAQTYVMLSALPTEIQERIKVAIQAIIAGR